MSFALTYITESAWAITEAALGTIVSIAQSHGNIEALEKKIGERPRNLASSSIRGSVGIIPVRGPLFKRAGLLVDHCGASSYESILRDLHEMLASPKVQSIVLDIDSPGGEASGCSELADHIHAARSEKPITAYIGGVGASAAYWIASACDKVYASDSAIIGSIGVQSVLRSDKGDGELKFVSSQSPKKNADPASEEGAAEVQRVIDGLAEVFVQKVARNRGVSRDVVMDRFGQGAVFVGTEAATRGMIDGISTLEGVIEQTGVHQVIQEITASLIAEKHPAVAAELIEIGVQRGLASAKAKADRESTIRQLAQGQVSQEFCQTLIENEKLSAQDAAVQILLEARLAGATKPTPQEDPRFAFDRKLSSLDIPIADASEQQKIDAQLSAAIDLAKTSGINFKGA
ncbi:MAG TPA: S49 family peptidase [Oligoflexus sp.]|uniref:S49 family peptidase n=1 Tax=Oligoflexus sp. TaxID=1971216 RepID=UPI002D69C37C|nr:S49 family peptidase [Oligoflexus sp.]HYX37111.1 S49 family peptidase [Oligoflexus sp.]